MAHGPTRVGSSTCPGSVRPVASPCGGWRAFGASGASARSATAKTPAVAARISATRSGGPGAEAVSGLWPSPPALSGWRQGSLARCPNPSLLPRCTAATGFPPEIISYAVWLYLGLSLSLRDVEALLAERGVPVTYETIGHWMRPFGPVLTQELRRRGRRPGDKLHLDEVALKINGRRHWHWRAVDQHGFVVDILVQSRRDQHAAEAFIRRAVEGWDYTPRVVFTDKLASYPPALRGVLQTGEHRRHKG
jgi:transposase-like protein